MLKLQIKQRIDTTENWTKSDPQLLKGELAFTSDGPYNGAFKIGNGSAKWSALPYAFSNQDGKLLTADDITLGINDNNEIYIKNTGVTLGTYGDVEKTVNNTVVIPRITVTATGQISEISAEEITIDTKMNVVNTSADYTAEANNSLITGNSGYTVTIPSMEAGTKLVIKNTATDDSNLIVAPNTGITFDGSTNSITLKPNQFITLVSISSSAWAIVAESSRLALTSAEVSTLTLEDNILK